MSACTKHAAKPVRGYSECPGCEVENLRQQLAAAQAEARELRRRVEEAERNYQWMVERAADQHLNGYRELARRAADAENVADGLRTKVQELRAEAQVLRERSAHVDRAATRLAVKKDALAQALARVRELPAKWRAAPQDPNEPLLAMAADELDAALSQAGEQHDPLAVSDHCPECSEPEPECACDERDTCTNCGGSGVGGYHVHAPQEDAVEALRCEACDGFGFIEHGPKDYPATAPELPLMARREWMFMGARYAFRDWDSVWFQSVHKPGRAWRFCYHIADTDENGLPIIKRTEDMPEMAKYRAKDGIDKFAYYSFLPTWARFDAVTWERIEDFNEHAQHG